MWRTIGIILALLVIVAMVASCINRNDEHRIETKIESTSGEVVEIKPISVFQSSPFFWRDKNDRVYKFTYINKDGIETVGWVKFSIFNKWIMDETEE